MATEEKQREREREGGKPGSERERESERDRTLWRTAGPSARRTAVRQLAHTIPGRVVPKVQGRATDPLPWRKASVEKDSRRTERLSAIGRLTVEGPDMTGDVRDVAEAGWQPASRALGR